MDRFQLENTDTYTLLRPVLNGTELAVQREDIVYRLWAQGDLVVMLETKSVAPDESVLLSENAALSLSKYLVEEYELEISSIGSIGYDNGIRAITAALVGYSFIVTCIRMIRSKNVYYNAKAPTPSCLSPLPFGSTCARYLDMSKTI